MKVAVTGADGFIGRNLVVALRRRGDDVRAVGDETDLREFQSAKEAVKGMDTVYHMAGQK